MSLIGQPENYSEMLWRIFTATLAAGIICTAALAAVSPSFHNFLQNWETEVSIGILESVKALYVLIPLAAAILSRIFLLHDKISNLFGMRRRFDIKYILRPLSEGVGFPTEGKRWESIKNNRDLAMTRTFYRYASFSNPKIDVQLVRTAADRWGWFWCTIEPQVILLIAAISFALLREWTELWIVVAGMVILSLIGLSIWPQVRKGARIQVGEILSNEEWKAEVRKALEHLSPRVAGTVAQPS